MKTQPSSQTQWHTATATAKPEAGGATDAPPVAPWRLMVDGFTIHRYPHASAGSPLQWCHSCQLEKAKGFWMYSTESIGQQAIFVCDDCLSAAKTHKFVKNGKPPETLTTLKRA